MHRFYLAPEEARADALLLRGNEAHHAISVLRVREGEEVIVLNGAGGELYCTVGTRTGKSLALNVRERKFIPPASCLVTLIQAIPKGKIIESVIQKATELGVSRIVPILSERVITHLDADSAEAKAEKWQQIAIEAIKQCGNAWLPKVEPPVLLKTFLARAEQFELPLVGCLEPGSRHPREWFEAFQSTHQRRPQSVAVWVGPEGDFSAAEYATIKSSGARPITLGPLVLRVETAATYGLAVVNYELQARQ